MTNNEYYQLSDYIQTQKIDVHTFLPLTIAICNKVYEAHKQNNMYHYLSPLEIWFTASFEVKIEKFQSIQNEQFSAVYMSPEQVVRDSKYINQSTDIYTLGIIFYEMLLGELPYAYNDLLELSHTVVTQNIPSLSKRDKNIPPIIASIIEKMLLVNQSERYKNILSVAIDLTKVLHTFDTENEVNDFKLDTYNNIVDLHNHDTLFGRENEKARLQYYIDSKTDKSNKIIVVHGKSGMGKSSLISNVIEHNKHLFSHVCKFKLEQGEESTPYQILYTALRKMTKQLIAQDNDIVEKYRHKLQSLLGNQAQILIDVIPEIEIIIGKQVEREVSDATDIRINLDNLLVSFMEIFLDVEKPLCIYIDDMQWADRVTIQWIKNVVLKLENIVLFMTYRNGDTGIRKNHLFTSMLHEFSLYELKVDQIDIVGLSKDDIYQLIENNIQIEESNEIAGIIFDRTKGNPFFVIQYLKQLQKDVAIWFDIETLEWKCDLNKIDSLQISDNVFDMLSKSIGSLDDNVRQLLCIASCMGNTFSHDLLEKVFDNNDLFEETLALALDSGWIVVDTPNHTRHYRFLHDKMQETIHTFLVDKMLTKVHYKIGCHIEQKRNPFDQNDLLSCVNHLNIGRLYVRDKHFLGQLNIEASFYAKKSGDFPNALKYIKTAMELCFFKASPEETAFMLKERAECEHLCNHSAEAIGYYEKALDLATDKLQKAEIYELLIKLHCDLSNFNKAYEIGRVASKNFGVSIPKSFTPPRFVAEFLHLKFKLRTYTVEDLRGLPESHDEDFIMLIRILANTLQAAYQIRPELCVENALIIVKLCLAQGVTKESVIGFTVFGVIFQGAILGNHQLGYDYSQLSFDMLKRFDNTTQHAEVKFVCGYFATSWKQSAVYTEENWAIAYKNGLEIGDWFHTGCAAAGIVQSMFMRGVAFEELFSKIKYFENILLNIGAKEQHGAMLSVKHTLLNLTGKTQSLLSYNSDTFNEERYVKSLDKYQSEHFAHYYFINKMISLYLHKEYAKAYQIYKEGKRYAKSSKGTLHHTEYMFYHALILSKLFFKVNKLKRVKYKKTINNIKNKFMKWAEDCPENFMVRAYMLQAEMFRINDHHSSVFLFYDKAIDLANIYGQKHLVAMAARSTSELYDTLGQYKAAKTYSDEALQSFNKWGITQTIYTDNEHHVNLDVNTLIKASEVIAQEYEYSSLLKILIQIVMENAGAQHGFVLLEKEGSFVVQASANKDTNDIEVMQETPYTEIDEIVHPIVNYVLRTKESVVIDDMTQSDIFDVSYVSSRLVKSVLCAPLMLQGELKGLIYLENNLLSSVFTEDKVKLLQYLSGQIVISIENTIVYSRLEEKIKQRTKDLEASKDELKVLASMDSMTQLYNRRYFSEISEELFEINKRVHKNFSLIMLDIDNFKNVNDTYGHHIGDEVIITIAKILRENTRKSDVVCRFGGEEYIILLPETTSEISMDIAENIRELVEQLVIKLSRDKELRVTISMGVSMVNTLLDSDVELAINKADNALYEAKRSGKNRVCQYTENYQI